MRQVSDEITCLIVSDHTQSGSGIEDRFGQDTGTQPADLIDGQYRSLAVKPDSETNQEVMSQSNQQHVMMPAQPTACFTVVKTDFALAFFEDDFNRPAHAAEANGVLQGDGLWYVASNHASGTNIWLSTRLYPRRLTYPR